MEDDDDEEDVELEETKKGISDGQRATKAQKLTETKGDSHLIGSRKSKGETDSNGVKDDSELQHRDSEDLSSGGKKLRGILESGVHAFRILFLLVRGSLFGKSIGAISSVAMGMSAVVAVVVGVRGDTELLELFVP